MKSSLILLVILILLNIYLNASSWGKDNFNNLKENSSAIFNSQAEKVYGIGFRPKNGNSFNEYVDSNERLNDALDKVEELGYNLIRTWGFNSYSTNIYENIINNNRKIKVQQGIWLNSSDINTCINIIDSVLVALAPYKDSVLGVSLLNETENIVTPETLEALILYAKNNYPDFLYTANFLAGTLNNEAFRNVFLNLDYINVNEYGGYFGYLNNHSIERQIDSISKKTYTAVNDDKLIVIGETGWQSSPRNTTEAFDSKLNISNLSEYYYKISNLIYNSDTRYGFMFYFNLNSAAWKDNSNNGGYNDNDWGIFSQGNESSIGSLIWNVESVSNELKTKLNDGNIIGITTHHPVIPILNMNNNFVNINWENNDYIYLQISNDLNTWITLEGNSPYVTAKANKSFYRTKVIYE